LYTVANTFVDTVSDIVVDTVIDIVVDTVIDIVVDTVVDIVFSVEIKLYCHKIPGLRVFTYLIIIKNYLNLNKLLNVFNKTHITKSKI